MGAVFWFITVAIVATAAVLTVLLHQLVLWLLPELHTSVAPFSGIAVGVAIFLLADKLYDKFLPASPAAAPAQTLPPPPPSMLQPPVSSSRHAIKSAATVSTTKLEAKCASALAPDQNAKHSAPMPSIESAVSLLALYQGFVKLYESHQYDTVQHVQITEQHVNEQVHFLEREITFSLDQFPSLARKAMGGENTSTIVERMLLVPGQYMKFYATNTSHRHLGIFEACMDATTSSHGPDHTSTLQGHSHFLPRAMLVKLAASQLLTPASMADSLRNWVHDAVERGQQARPPLQGEETQPRLQALG